MLLEEHLFITLRGTFPATMLAKVMRAFPISWVDSLFVISGVQHMPWSINWHTKEDILKNVSNQLVDGPQW